MSGSLANTNKQGLLQEDGGTETRRINYCFCISHAINTALGFLQFGFALGGWNTLQASFGSNYHWDDGQERKWGTLLTVIVCTGAMIAALFGSLFVKYGKFNMILVSNAITLLGSAMRMIDNMYVISAGTFLIGLGSGAFTIYCPKYLQECCPQELAGPLGTMNQFMVCLGIAVPAWMTIPVPVDPKLHPDEFLVTQYWRIVWAWPFIFSAIQVPLMLTVFRYDSPVEMKAWGKKAKLLEFNKRCYPDFKEKDEANEDEDQVESEAPEEEISYSEALFHPDHRRATWISVGIAVTQQLSGVNAIVFYSADIFKAAKVNPNLGTAYTATVSWLMVLGSTVFLKWVGRKALFVVFFMALSIIAVCMSLCMIYKQSTLEMVCTFAYMTAFQLGPGPVSWLYMSEISSNKGMSIATFTSWVFTLAIGIMVEPLINSWTKNYTFMIFGVTNLLAALFCLIFVKETKGKSRKELIDLYRHNKIAKYAPVHETDM